MARWSPQIHPLHDRHEPWCIRIVCCLHDVARRALIAELTPIRCGQRATRAESPRVRFGLTGSGAESVVVEVADFSGTLGDQLHSVAVARLTQVAHDHPDRSA